MITLIALTFTEFAKAAVFWFLGFLIFALGCPRLS